MEQDQNPEQNEQKDIGQEIQNQATQMAANKAKDVAKDVTSKALKNVVNTALRSAATAIASLISSFFAAIAPILIPILIVFVIFFGGKWVIDNYVSDSSSKAVTNIIEQYCTIDENGIHIDKNASIQAIKEELEKGNIKFSDLGFGYDTVPEGTSTEVFFETQAARYVYNFMVASIISELPYIEGSDEELKGIVHFVRKEKDKPYELKYIGYEKFKEMLNSEERSKKEESKQYYSLDESWNLCVTKAYIVEVNGAEVQYDIHEVKIPYRNMVSQYAMPFEFLMNLQSVAQSANYVQAVADLVKYNNRIELTIFDSITTSTEVYTYRHSTMRRYIQTHNIHDPITGEVVDAYYTEEVAGPEKQPDQVTTTITKEDSIKANVTSAKTWILKQEIIYEIVPKDPEYPLGENGQTIKLDNEDAVPEGETGTWKVEQSTTTKTTIETNEWQMMNGTYSNLTPNLFLGLWKNDTGKYVKGAKFNPNGKEVKYVLPQGRFENDSPQINILGAQDWLCQLLQNNQKTQFHAELMRYLIHLYKNDGVDDGNIVLDLSIFEPEEFNEDTSFYAGEGGALEEFIKAWEGTKTDASGNYRVFSDSKGNATVGYGICIKWQKSRLNERGLTELTSYNRESDLFGKVLVGKNDLIDDITREIINEFRQDIIKSTMGLNLEDTQIDALVAIKFQYGNIGNFVEQYKKYGNTEGLKNAVHSNGGGYYFKNGIPQPRAVANWKLFHEGVYTTKSGTVIASSGGGSKIDVSNLTGNAKTVVSKALEQVGKMYVWGGETPEVGFDCSGLVKWAYAQVEVELPHSANGIAQRLAGKEVKLSTSELKAGDILWKSGHIAIYIGNDSFVHAPGRGKQITTANFTNRQKGSYAFTKAYRIIP